MLRCPHIGECQDREAGVGRLANTGMEDGLEDFHGGNQESEQHLKCK